MRALLLLSLFAAQVDGLEAAQRPGEVAQRQREWVEQLTRAYEHRERGEFDAALVIYSELIAGMDDPPEGVDFSHAADWNVEWLWKHSALCQRGETYLLAGQPRQALEDFRTCERTFGIGENIPLLEQMARAHEMLGETDRAEGIRRRIGDIERRALWDQDLQQRALSFCPPWLRSPTGPMARVVQLIAACLVSALLAAVLIVVNVLIGQRQRREGGGTWMRLLSVSAIVAALQTAPLLVALAAGALMDEASLSSDMFRALPFCLMLNIVLLFSVVRPPARLLHTKEALPLVEEDAFLARVAWLASQMKLRPPRVRLIRSVGGELQAMAIAGGLVAPSLVVSDGILHRLSPDERDAVVGHELAHLANGSLWFLIAVYPLAMSAAVLAAAFFPMHLALPFSLLLYVGLQRMVSRYFEYDCDRRAAKVIGFTTMISALTKIHAAHLFRNTGRLSALLYCTSTHPSRDERLAALHEAAPPDDRPAPSWSPAEVRRRRRGARLAAMAALAGLIGFPTWHLLAPSWGPSVGLALMGVTPWMLVLFATVRATRFERRRRRIGAMAWIAVPLIVVAAVTVIVAAREMLIELPGEMSGLFDSDIPGVRWVLWIVPIAMLLPLLLPKHWWGAQIQQQVDLAIQRHDFAEVVRLAEQSPKKFAKNPALRHVVALSSALAGDRERAIPLLEQMIEDEPKFHEPRVSLSMIYCDEARIEPALEVIEPLIRALPGDPAPARQRAWCLRLLGRLEEAEDAVARAIELDAESGRAHAIAAAIAIDRGAFGRAAESLKKAEEHDPGTGFVETIKAEYALARGDDQTAREQLRRALTACEANPFALLNRYVARLQERLPDQTRPSA